MDPPDWPSSKTTSFASSPSGVVFVESIVKSHLPSLPATDLLTKTVITIYSANNGLSSSIIEFSSISFHIVRRLGIKQICHYKYSDH